MFIKISYLIQDGIIQHGVTQQCHISSNDKPNSRWQTEKYCEYENPP